MANLGAEVSLGNLGPVASSAIATGVEIRRNNWGASVNGEVRNDVRGNAQTGVIGEASVVCIQNRFITLSRRPLPSQEEARKSKKGK